MPDRHGKYSYYDSPDGKDGHKKAWYVAKNMAKLGMFSATVDAFVVTAPATKLGVLAVYARHVGVLVGAGLAYTCGTFIATDVRKVDDQKNHVVGAVAASAIVGAAFSNPWIFATLALASAPAVHTIKTYQMAGYKVFDIGPSVRAIPKYFPSANYHVFELAAGKDSLRKRYEEKNEEYYRQRGNLDKESSV